MSAVVPELLVSNLNASLDFWCGLLGFEKAYDRPEEKFAYLRLEDVDFMLEEVGGSARQWITGALDQPFGRGINFQIELSNIDASLSKIQSARWPLYLAPEEKYYHTGNTMSGQRQFMVQDPDGYLLRFCTPIEAKA